jgi:molybdate transport system regulatory protein
MDNRFSDVQLKYKIWLESSDGKGLLGDGKWQIMRAIESEGSLMAACSKLGITYRRTWNDLKKIEQMLGFRIIEKKRGGKEGGKTVLSEEGRHLVNAFNHFHADIDGLIQEKFKNMLTELRK